MIFYPAGYYSASETTKICKRKWWGNGSTSLTIKDLTLPDLQPEKTRPSLPRAVEGMALPHCCLLSVLVINAALYIMNRFNIKEALIYG
jgi:hypothetical protein